MAGGVALNCVANGKIIKKEFLMTLGSTCSRGCGGGCAALYASQLKKPKKIKNNKNDF